MLVTEARRTRDSKSGVTVTGLRTKGLVRGMIAAVGQDKTAQIRSVELRVNRRRHLTYPSTDQLIDCDTLCLSRNTRARLSRVWNTSLAVTVTDAPNPAEWHSSVTTEGRKPAPVVKVRPSVDSRRK